MGSIAEWIKKHLGWVVAGAVVLAASVNGMSSPPTPAVDQESTVFDESLQTAEISEEQGEVQAGEEVIISPAPELASESPEPSVLPSPRPSPLPSPIVIVSPKPAVQARDPIQPVQKVIPAPATSQGGWSCNCKKTCPTMSCAEAQFQLNQCGCSARDADNDGLACDSQCG